MRSIIGHQQPDRLIIGTDYDTTRAWLNQASAIVIATATVPRQERSPEKVDRGAVHDPKIPTLLTTPNAL